MVDSAKKWETVSGDCRGDVSWGDLPQEVREYVRRLRENPMDEEEGPGWTAFEFVDEPHGQRWEVSLSRDELDMMEVQVSKVIYKERWHQTFADADA